MMTNKAHIRPEQTSDFAAVFEVNRMAFETDAEARLVGMLRPVAVPLISLVAVVKEEVVGHILFTPVTVRGQHGSRQAMGLGPMAVYPRYQRRGIGGALIRAGLEACDALSEAVIFVLGHRDYYPRFGFVPAAPKGLHYKDASFDPYFMVAERVPGVLEGMSGFVEYLPAFEAV